MLRAVLLACCLVLAEAMDNLSVAFEWKQLDFEFPTEQARQDAIDSRDFVPENNLPLGLEVYNDRLFVTVPRWKSGVPASLTYIFLNDTSKSPKLRPYPNWEAHKLPEAEIVSPFRVRADACGRLWVLDTGLADILGDVKSYGPAKLAVYDLRTDTLVRRFNIPNAQLKEGSFFATLAIEDHDCENSYAYVADLGVAGLVVYSWREQRSWRVQHHYFNIDPMAGEFNVNGIRFQWSDHLFGLALSAPDAKGYSTLFFHPMVSTNEFAVSTQYLRDEQAAKQIFDKFRLLGERGPNAQAGVSCLDKRSGVLFYALLNLNAVACWRTTNPAYNMQSQGRVHMSNVTMVFPNDLTVDPQGNLWVLSDRLPQFMYSRLDQNDVNFRVLRARVADAIRGTACDSKLVVPGTSSILKTTAAPALDVDNRFKKSAAAGPAAPALLCSALLLLLRLPAAAHASL